MLRKEGVERHIGLGMENASSTSEREKVVSNSGTFKAGKECGKVRNVCFI